MQNYIIFSLQKLFSISVAAVFSEYIQNSDCFVIVHKMDSNTYNNHSFDLDANLLDECMYLVTLVTKELLSSIGIGNVQNTMHYTCSEVCLLVMIVKGVGDSTKTIA